MKTQVRTAMTQALVSSLLIGGAAFAQDKAHPTPAAGSEAHGKADKNTAQPGTSPEPQDAHKKPADEKNSCKGKNGCKGKDACNTKASPSK